MQHFFISHSTSSYAQVLSTICLVETRAQDSFYLLAHVSANKSLPTDESTQRIQRRLAMEAAMNYAHSYEMNTDNHLKRTGSTRQYAASLQRTIDPHGKTMSIPTTTSNSPIQRTSSIVSHEIDDNSSPFRTSRRVLSSTSLSSTGYDSNSSPSIKSTRNSIATTNSNDFIVHSICSSSASSSSSSDEPR